jgi:hypothetical protein
MCHMRRRRIHVSYEEEEDTCVCPMLCLFI